MKTKTSASAKNKKGNSTKKTDLVKLNLVKSAANAKAERVTKYRYPDDVKTAQEKKLFRRKSRATIAGFKEAINSKDQKAAAQAKKDLAAWETKYFNPVTA